MYLNADTELSSALLDICAQSALSENSVYETAVFLKRFRRLASFIHPVEVQTLDLPTAPLIFFFRCRALSTTATLVCGGCTRFVVTKEINLACPTCEESASVSSPSTQPLCMLRPARSSSTMGLLDGLNSLQGAPPPQVQAPIDPGQQSSSDPISQFSNSARSVFGDIGNTIAPSLENFNESAKTSVSSLRRFITDEPDDLEAPAQMSLSEEMSTMFNLTLFQRVALFAMIFGTGVLMICMSFTFLPLIVIVPHKFAASFTLGNVLAIVSTWVLVGPRAQLQSMFHPLRAVAAGVYLFSLLFALVAAFFGGKLRYILVLVALVAEVASCKFVHDRLASECMLGGVVQFSNKLCTFSTSSHFFFSLQRSDMVCTKLHSLWKTHDNTAVLNDGGFSGIMTESRQLMIPPRHTKSFGDGQLAQ